LFHATAVVAAWTLQSTVASAEPAACPAPPEAPGLAAVDTEARLRFLEGAFEREVAAEDLWSWAWGSTYVAAGAAQGITAAVIRDHGARIDLTVGAVSAGIGALTLYGLPLQVTLPLNDVLRRRGDADRCRLLADAEATLVAVADRQRLSSGFLPHVGNVLFNAGLALVLGWGFGRWKSAAISAGVGVAVGEINVLTQPHRLPGVLDRYRAAHLDDAEEAAPAPPLVAGASGNGIGLSWALRF
jgi:hypothetical protein